MLQNLDERHMNHISLWHSQLSPQTHHNTKLNVRKNYHSCHNKPFNGTTNNKGDSNQQNHPSRTPTTHQYLHKCGSLTIPHTQQKQLQNADLTQQATASNTKRARITSKGEAYNHAQDHQLQGCSVPPNYSKHTAPQGMDDNIFSTQPMPKHC